MTFLCLPACSTGDQAVRHFSRPRFRNLFGLLARPLRVAAPDVPATRVPPFVELLWMPAYAVCLHTVARDKQKSVWTCVDGWSEYFALFEGIEDLAPRELREEAFSPSITETRAAELARKGLMHFILGQRGQINKPVISAVEDIRLYYFPLWVCCYRRWGKTLDIKVLDGYTGKSGGAKMRVSVLNALVAARRQRQES